MKPHAAVVLAAGGSTRLGHPKQLLRRDGEPLVARAVRVAAATHPARLLVVVGGNADQVANALACCECETLYNPAWEDGLASSLRTAATALRDFDGAVLVLGCDQPALEAEHLAVLLQGAHRSPARAAATRHVDRPGIPAVVPSAWFNDWCGAGDQGFRQRLRSLPGDALFVLDVDSLEIDVDDARDVAHAAAEGWIDPAPDAPPRADRDCRRQLGAPPGALVSITDATPRSGCEQHPEG